MTLRSLRVPTPEVSPRVAIRVSRAADSPESLTSRLGRRGSNGRPALKATNRDACVCTVQSISVSDERASQFP